MKTDLRSKIIQTALLLFEEKGYHGVSINEIVTEAGTSKGGFYHHFSSKDELLYVIHDIFITYAIENAKLAARSYESPLEQLQAIIKSFVGVFHVYKPHLTVFYQEAKYLHPKYDEIIRKKRDEFRQIIYDVVKAGKERGEFRQELEVDIVVMAILGMVNWIYKWYNRDGEKTISQIADIFTDFILHAVLKAEYLDKDTYESILIEPFYFTKTKK
ncbi:MAG: TetR/AcrR family transcriptional regulator [Bacilli bacterium]|nr:TetR/AcrR family transcriptional regulator [Bacilli bacterium]